MAKIVGLTGGIATGKSTVARMFVELGVALVDADQVARDVVEPGEPALVAIIDAFGREVLDGGRLDRKKLGRVVFGDEAARARLNTIIHPRIAAESQRRLATLAATHVPYVMYDAALLVENGLHRAFAALVVVSVSPEMQLRRLMGRDDSSLEAARKRINSQMPVAEKEGHADFVILNEGSRTDTHQRVEVVHRALVERLS